MIVKKCERCGKEFSVWPSIIKRGGGKYCSNRCSALNRIFSEKTRKKMSERMINNIPWNKNLKGWNDGHPVTPETKIKISNSKLGKKRPNISDKNHYYWKGDNVGYLGLHSYISSRLGKPTKCEFCGKDGLVGRQIHWANKSGLYLRELSDWLRLCVSCHKKYDKRKNHYNRFKELELLTINK